MRSFWSIHAVLLLSFLMLLLFATTVPGLRISPDPGCNFNRRDALIGAGTVAAMATTTATLSTTPFRAMAAMDSPPQPSTVASSSISTTTTTIPTWRLERGVDFPKLALNTAGLDTDGAERAFRNALQAGICHVEFHPGIERDGVARVLRSIQGQGYPTNNNKSVFLTTKIETNWENSPTLEKAAGYVQERLDTDLEILGVPSLDMLLLRESTDCSIMRAMWAEMERELEAGRVRSLGVANYCESALQCLLATARYKPQVNYLQLHVGMGPFPKARAFGEQQGIKTLAYGHLGEKARPTDDTQQIRTNPILVDIAQKHSKRAEDVALRWVLQNGAAASIRPTADFVALGGICHDPECFEGLQASSQAFAWELTTEEMKQLNAQQTPNSNPTLFSSPGCPGSYFETAPTKS